VVFERSHDYRVGDLVVVLGDDGYTLEYFKKDIPRQIVGVVTGSFRKYK
jgi:SOS-response transcriptional repressor LexA